MPAPAREPWLPRRALICGLAGCHAAAFASLHAQLPGLYGRDGLLPIAPLLRSVGANTLIRRFAALPTLLWLHAPLSAAPDALAGALCLAGACVAGVVATAAAVRPVAGGASVALALLALHALYASLFAVGQAFLSFQWDILLLEATLMAALLAALPGTHLPPAFALPPRLLLFKLMLMSGATKLQSGCPTWAQLSALSYHFATQPLPTPFAWRAATLPAWQLRTGVAVALALEGPACWLLLCPLRGARHVGAVLQLAFQLGIAATGNYTFFNAATAVLALACMSAPALRPPARAERAAAAAAVLATLAACAACFSRDAHQLRLELTGAEVTAWLGFLLPSTMRVLFWLLLPAEALRGCARAWRRGNGGRLLRLARVAGALAAALAAGALCALTAAPLATLLPAGPARHAVLAAIPALPAAARDVAAVAHASSGYGLFRAMTGVGAGGAVARPELTLQGRPNATSAWLDIPFRYKPFPTTPPRWVAPHQPRLDWQMWFAALGSPASAPWAVHLAAHALRGTPDVWALLAPGGPFSAAAPPAEVRILRWQLSFSAPGSAEATRGDWWVAAAPPHEWLQPLRLSAELDAWLAARGWTPATKRGARRRRSEARLRWARGGQPWAGVAAAGAGAAAAACCFAAAPPARRARSKHD